MSALTDKVKLFSKEVYIADSTIVIRRIPTFLRLVVGLPFIVIAMAMESGVHFDKNKLNFPLDLESPWPEIFLAFFGLMALGLRHHTIIELSRRTIINYWGWMVILYSRETALGEWTQVQVGPVEERGQGSGRHTAIPVCVIGTQGRSEVQDGKSMLRARQLATLIGSITGLKIIDRTTLH